MNLIRISYFNDLLRIIFYAITGYFALRFFFFGSVQILTTFFTRSVSFDIDTLFLHWNTTYPAITVCEVYNQEQWRRILNTTFQNDSEIPPEDVLIDIIYFRGFCTNCWQCGMDDTCNINNLTILSNQLRMSCEDLIFNCVYQNHFFSCCDQFKPIFTEYGTCFALNSHQALKSIEHYSINRTSGFIKLLFDVASDVDIFIHGNNEVPYFLAENIITERVKHGLTKEILLQIMEVHNDADVIELPIEKRRCRFEKELVAWPQLQNFYTFYSYSSCIVECSVLLHLELCNCTQHFLAQAAHSVVQNLNVSMCDYRGLQCLSDNHDVFRQRSISCNCLSSCIETDFDLVFSSANNDKEYFFDEARVGISILDLPTERYVRHVTRDYLNLLISFGGLLGLFFNISFLRLVEILIKLFKSCCVFIKKLKQKFHNL